MAWKYSQLGKSCQDPQIPPLARSSVGRIHGSASEALSVRPGSQPRVLLGKERPIGKTKHHSEHVASPHGTGGPGHRPHFGDGASEPGAEVSRGESI